MKETEGKTVEGLQVSEGTSKARIGDQLKQERIAAGAGFESVARGADISFTGLRWIEANSHSPSQDQIDDIRASISMERGLSGRTWIDWRHELRKIADEMDTSYSGTVLQALADELARDGYTSATEETA